VQDECGNYSGVSGSWDFWGLIKAGWLTKKGAPAKNIGYIYDTCSQTVGGFAVAHRVSMRANPVSQPYVYNATSEVMVSFDNVQSFAAKGTFVKHAGLRGFAMWEAGGDHDDMLLDSIRGTIGF
jgi:chitinase